MSRITAWGQTMVQLPHWMQMSWFQTGIFSAILRFSYFVVPVGKVPSSGSLDTGIFSPLAAMISPITSLTKAGAVAGTGARILVLELTAPGVTLWVAVRARSMAAIFLATTSAPFLM